MSEMAVLIHRVKDVEEKIETINDTVEDMNQNVNLVVMLLRGNEFDKNDNGMIGELNDYKKRLERLEKFKDRMFWILITAAGVTGLNLFQLIDLVVKALKTG